MQNALNFFYYAFSQIVNYLNSIYIVSGVSVLSFMIVLAISGFVVVNIMLIAKRG